jgi:hypothetical protein
MADQIVQEGSLAGQKGQQVQNIPLDQFDTLGGSRQLNFVQLDVLTSVIGGGQGTGSGVAVQCDAALTADYLLGVELLASTAAVIDLLYPNNSPSSFTVFDNDTDMATIDQAADLVPWIGTGTIVLKAQVAFSVSEDPAGIVNFGAGGSAQYTVTYDYTVVSTCPADLDGNGAVDITDFLALLAAWGTDPGGPPDLDGDGDVGIADFLQLLGSWGRCS